MAKENAARKAPTTAAQKQANLKHIPHDEFTLLMDGKLEI